MTNVNKIILVAAIVLALTSAGQAAAQVDSERTLRSQLLELVIGDDENEDSAEAERLRKEAEAILQQVLQESEFLLSDQAEACRRALGVVRQELARHDTPSTEHVNGTDNQAILEQATDETTEPDNGVKATANNAPVIEDRPITAPAPIDVEREDPVPVTDTWSFGTPEPDRAEPYEDPVDFGDLSTAVMSALEQIARLRENGYADRDLLNAEDCLWQLLDTFYPVALASNERGSAP